MRPIVDSSPNKSAVEWTLVEHFYLHFGSPGTTPLTASGSANGAIPLAEGCEISDLAIWSVPAGNLPALRPCWM